MRCPDDLALDLWLADALPSAEAAELAAHAEACPRCQARLAARGREDGALAAALALDADELAFLASLDLAGRWRPGWAASWWGWLALLASLASLGAWSLARPLVGQAFDLVIRSGLAAVLLHGLLSATWAIGQTLVLLASSPLLAYSLPLLALVGLALLLVTAGSSRAPARQG